ncbi:MAG: hypothetical protein ABL878_09980 [Burkholderiales bacterium]
MKPVPRGSVPARSRKPRNASGWTISPKVSRRPRSKKEGLEGRQRRVAHQLAVGGTTDLL